MGHTMGVSRLILRCVGSPRASTLTSLSKLDENDTIKPPSQTKHRYVWLKRLQSSSPCQSPQRPRIHIQRNTILIKYRLVPILPPPTVRNTISKPVRRIIRLFPQ